MYFVYMFIGYIQNTVYRLLKVNVWYDMIINKISATMFDVEIKEEDKAFINSNPILCCV